MNNRRFFLGCAVWAYKDWVGDLFPSGSKSSDFLRLYSRRLTTVEGNTTFYATPNADIVQRWIAETPPDFKFCLKLPREVSHTGSLVGQIATTQAFLERMAPLGSRLGPFFLQLPPGYHPRQITDLERWLEAWPSARPLTVELRHIDWYAPEAEAALTELLKRYNAGRVIMDVRPLEYAPLPGAEQDLQRARDNKPNVPMHAIRSSDIAMVRYIGHPDLPVNTSLIDEWAERIIEWLAQGTQVYFFMHCPQEQFSPQLCRMLQQRLNGRPGVPDLPWEQSDEPPAMEQATMF